jgi:hypothetical protein
MKFEDTVEVLAEKREKLLDSVELCFDSVNFWEEKAHILFNKIDELEENYNSFPETELENKQEEYSKSLKILIYRLSLEKNQLDILEKNLIRLELKIVNFVKNHAKKQKK